MLDTCTYRIFIDWDWNTHSATFTSPDDVPGLYIKSLNPSDHENSMGLIVAQIKAILYDIDETYVDFVEYRKDNDNVFTFTFRQTPKFVL
jgi:hypothetical protein